MAVLWVDRTFLVLLNNFGKNSWDSLQSNTNTCHEAHPFCPITDIICAELWRVGYLTHTMNKQESVTANSLQLKEKENNNPGSENMLHSGPVFCHCIWMLVTLTHMQKQPYWNCAQSQHSTLACIGDRYDGQSQHSTTIIEHRAIKLEPGVCLHCLHMWSAAWHEGKQRRGYKTMIQN